MRPLPEITLITVDEMVRSLSEFDFVDATKPATPLEVNDDSDYDKDEIINDAKLTIHILHLLELQLVEIWIQKMMRSLQSFPTLV